MALATSQKLNYVLPSMPFGDAHDGDLTISSNTTFSTANASCSGSGVSLTLGAASTFANGDVVLVYQSRGTGAGQWEVAKISSGGGTTSLVLTRSLQYTYTDSGASQAQVLTISQYNNVTVNTGVTWTTPEWDGNTGGILTFATRGTLTVTGTITSDSKGFVLGGLHTNGSNNAIPGYQAEGSAGAGQVESTVANGNGGGGGGKNTGSGNSTGGGGGGGGGNSIAGSNGGGGTLNQPGTGGSAVSSIDLVTIVMGGGGGCGSGYDNLVGGNGGDGAGIIIIFASNITGTGTITLDGAVGTSSGNMSGGGGGAGGSLLIISKTVTLTNLSVGASAGVGGTAGSGWGMGGDGSVGAIAIHHSGTVTGTTTPTYSDTSDTTLVEGGLAFIL
jgi:hypothetical protein